jgi:hypothetical protein
MERSLHISHPTPAARSTVFVHHRHRLVSLTIPNAAAPSVPPYSSSEDSEDASTKNNAVEVDLVELAAAEESIAQQQAAGLPPPYDVVATKVILN